MWRDPHRHHYGIRKLIFLCLLLIVTACFACSSKKNVIQGKVTYIDDVIQIELPAENVNVYLYQSIVVFQDHPDEYDKVVNTGPSGYYSMFPIPDGPYYVYSEKLDTNGAVLYSSGNSVHVDGHETKVVDIFLH